MTLFTSCQQNNKPSSVTSKQDSLKTNTVKNEVPQETDNYILPSPMQIASIYKKAGLAYVPGLINPIKDASQYSSTYSEAINMGIYGADLTYCVLNKQNQDALGYLKTLRSLADKLGFGNVFESDQRAKRFQDNLNSLDSLTIIISDLQSETDTYLTTNQKKYVGVISFAGAWVESMYLGSKVYSQKMNDRINSRISEQMNILQNLINALNVYTKQDSHIPDMVNSLKKIEDDYMGYEEVKAAAASSNDNVPKLSNAHINELCKQVQELRQKFVS